MNARLIAAFAAVLALAVPAWAETPGFSALEGPQNDANAKPGPRTLPSRVIAVPNEPGLSPDAQKLIAAPYRAMAWNANPPDAEAWRTLVKKLADATLEPLAKAREALGVQMEQTTLGGVNCYVLTPKIIPEAHRNQLIINPHGGGYVYGPGVSGTAEAMLMAAYGGYKVIEIDYRMPPDAPYPAAMDDAMAVYREVIKMQDPSRIAIIGTSTGGGMTLAMILRARAEGLPLPAAIAPARPGPTSPRPATATRPTNGSTTCWSATAAISAMPRCSTPTATI